MTDTDDQRQRLRADIAAVQGDIGLAQEILRRLQAELAALGEDRILWNRRPTNPVGGGGDIDEIVITDCTVHVEQMDDRCWWIGIYKGDSEEEGYDGPYWMGNFTSDSRGRMTFAEQENCGIRWADDDTHEEGT